MNLDVSIYNLAFTRVLQQPAMLSKLRASDESFRRRMWKRIETAGEKEKMLKLTEE